MNVKRKSGLGNNPLASAPTAKGIFHKTETGNQNPENETISSIAQIQPDTLQTIPPKTPETGNQNPENGFLQASRELDKITLRIPIELNDWLDSLLKQGKRKHGQKIPKEIWVQAALELLRSMPVDWAEVQDLEQMREKLKILENGIQKP
ncbi:hypothetical protein H6G45_00590 [Synechocystis sp. FACHB-383]|uniref:hypothetical protein n=1 Tax=unclassified Synechocystis TaxID=2640012 RepID=UPI0016886EE1|nr:MULTISPECIES: hypothetical protein [unclassified Synechocystis]MBD2652010.1 hypothetical protein [Synechocystis sp. FACHB-383]MBE9193998.1 hypothetical protein [Synechocystis sp. LEGE 06083]